jgi:selenide,water dikinase
MIDMEKRKRIMRRSMQLGHCICDPKKGCPCDIFREKNVCPCAGERLEEPVGPVRLTELVHSPGCASKIDQVSLNKVLEGLPTMDDPRVLVGVPAGDDAGVFQLDDETALVQTVDVFSPSVDDPYVFGQVAAANSLSDVYAMGGRPISALSIIGFPIRSVPDDVMHQILRGGIDKMTEAGVPVIGGHSINDQEIKAGFAVTGLINPKEIYTNAGARPGDRLVLTKPLGIGIIAFAAQIGRAPAEGLEASARSMAALNRRAAELMAEFGAHACTDVTGFALMGHGGGTQQGIVGPLRGRGRQRSAGNVGHLFRPANFRRTAHCRAGIRRRRPGGATPRGGRFGRGRRRERYRRRLGPHPCTHRRAETGATRAPAGEDRSRRLLNCPGGGMLPGMLPEGSRGEDELNDVL